MKLLQAAAEIAGGPKALARRLDVDPALLERYMADGRALPDRILLRAVDMILAERQVRMSSPVEK